MIYDSTDRRIRPSQSEFINMPQFIYLVRLYTRQTQIYFTQREKESPPKATYG